MNTIKIEQENKLVCSHCGSHGSTQQKIKGKWLCMGCVYWLASWAVEHGALLTLGE